MCKCGSSSTVLGWVVFSAVDPPRNRRWPLYENKAQQTGSQFNGHIKMSRKAAEWILAVVWLIRLQDLHIFVKAEDDLRANIFSNVFNPGDLIGRFREGWRNQIRWIFGKIPNGLWPPPLIFGKLYCKFFIMDIVAFMQGGIGQIVSVNISKYQLISVNINTIVEKNIPWTLKLLFFL